MQQKDPYYNRPPNNRPSQAPPPPSPAPYYPYPPPMPFHKPYFIPYHVASPQIIHGMPMEEVDKLLPTVPFGYRPLAMKITMGLVVALDLLCIAYIWFMVSQIQTNDPSFVFFNTLFLMIAMFGVSALFLLIVPKKAGWYFALSTAIMALPIFSIGSLISGFNIRLYPSLFITIAALIIAILIIITLFIPMTRFYFHTGQYPPERIIHQNYGAR
jgi:hypothetical protein